MKNKRLMVGILSIFVLVGMMVVPTFAQEVVKSEIVCKFL